MLKKKVAAIRSSMYISVAIVSGTILFVSAYILISGLASITPSLFEFEYNSTNVSLFPAFINTIIIMFMALIFAIPIAVLSAVYLTEYAPKSNRFVKYIQLAAETLAGIPSIVYGLFGMLFFVIYLQMGFSILAGALTLAIMVLPVIMRTAEEALIAVPDTFREGSFGLGAGKLRTTFKIILPTAFPGIFAGIILSVGRIFGETAALIFTAGTATGIAQSLNSSGRTLAVHLYNISSEGLYMQQAAATAAVLFIMVVIINSAAYFAAGKLGKSKDG